MKQWAPMRTLYLHPLLFVFILYCFTHEQTMSNGLGLTKTEGRHLPNDPSPDLSPPRGFQ